MSGNYWDSVVSQRATRRRVLSGVSAIGAGAAAISLVGCGSGGGSGSGSNGAAAVSGLKDTTAQAKPGGTWAGFLASDIPTMDPMRTSSTLVWTLVGSVYSRLFKETPTVLKAYDGAVEGDLIESWETPDPKTVTLKIRQNAVWEDGPVLNKRPLDAQDVVFSWQRFEAGALYRADLSYKVSDVAPIESVTALDTKTVQLKLAFPYSALLQMLSSRQRFWVMPRETETKFDPKGQAHGSGPWIVDKWQPSASLTYRRNPDWYFTGRPFLNRAEYPIVPEYATQLAQYRAGNIYAGVVRQEDLLSTKADFPQHILYQLGRSIRLQPTFFGWRQGSPFRDDRVRQASSMAIDRDLWLDTTANISKFKAAGLAVDPRWDTGIGAGYDDFWLDPQGSSFGPNAKYFKYDPAEAKKLLAAAGFPNGFDTENKYPISSAGQSASNDSQIINGMMADVGIRAKYVLMDLNNEWYPQVYDSFGDFLGLNQSSYSDYPDPDGLFYGRYHSKSSRPQLPRGLDAKMDQMIEQQRAELDSKKRKAIIDDIQRYLAEKMYYVPTAHSVPYDIGWPTVGNIGVFNIRSTSVFETEQLVHYWITDEAKRAAS
jgi:peptide/nickel transport system substrate-binding protein